MRELVHVQGGQCGNSSADHQLSCVLNSFDWESFDWESNLFFNVFEFPWTN